MSTNILIQIVSHHFLSSFSIYTRFLLFTLHDMSPPPSRLSTNVVLILNLISIQWR